MTRPYHPENGALVRLAWDQMNEEEHGVWTREVALRGVPKDAAWEVIEHTFGHNFIICSDFQWVELHSRYFERYPSALEQLAGAADESA